MMLTGLNSTPNDAAAVWIAPHWPVPEGMAASRRTATRVTLGATSLSSSSHLAPMPYSNDRKPVTLPPGRAKLSTKPPPDRIAGLREHDRHGAGRLQQRRYDGAASSQDDVRRQRDQFRRISASALRVARAPAQVNANIASVGPAQLRQRLRERQHA